MIRGLVGTLAALALVTLIGVASIRMVGGGALATSAAPASAPARDPAAPRKVAILLYPGVELLDFSGPGEVFSAAGHDGAFEVFTVAPSAGTILSQRFVTITPRYTIADAPRPDILVIPGGAAGRVLQDPAAMAWVRSAAGDAEVILSVCNGALVLAKAGLLEGREATTHHGSLEELKRISPTTKVRSDRRFVDTGRIVTSAGVSAGIDGAMHVVERLLGREAARATARYMEYDWKEEPAP